jgi:hypothetical protein
LPASARASRASERCARLAVRTCSSPSAALVRASPAVSQNALLRGSMWGCAPASVGEWTRHSVSSKLKLEATRCLRTVFAHCGCCVIARAIAGCGARTRAVRKRVRSLQREGATFRYTHERLSDAGAARWCALRVVAVPIVVPTSTVRPADRRRARARALSPRGLPYVRGCHPPHARSCSRCRVVRRLQPQ